MKPTETTRKRRIKLREKLYEQDPCCWWCGGKTSLPPKGYFTPAGDERNLEASVEHLIPQAKGGTDEESNLVLSCHLCNRVRSDTSFFNTREGRQPLILQRRRTFPWMDTKNLYLKFNPVINESDDTCYTQKDHQQSVQTAFRARYPRLS